MGRSLIDTDTLSEILKGRNPAASSRAAEYLAHHGRFTFSLITRFEVLRGLKAKSASTQLVAFEERCRASEVLPVTDPVIVCASDLYAELRRRGDLLCDADLIIAATAMVHGLVLVTRNVEHFKRIAALELDCWTA